MSHQAQTPGAGEAEIAEIIRSHMMSRLESPAAINRALLNAAKAVTAALAAQPEKQGGAGAGWKLVPEWPTVEMIHASTGLWPHAYRYEDIAPKASESWRLMFAAAPPPPAGEAVGGEPVTLDVHGAKAVAEAITKNGWWHSCTGCHETNEGYETGHYPYSGVFRCYVGAGCSECGGLGVVWERFTAADQAALEAEMSSPAESSTPTPQPDDLGKLSAGATIDPAPNAAASHVTNFRTLGIPASAAPQATEEPVAAEDLAGHGETNLNIAPKVRPDDIDKLADDYVLRVSEWDDRTSPNDWPEALLITRGELKCELIGFAQETLGIGSVPDLGAQGEPVAWAYEYHVPNGEGVWERRVTFDKPRDGHWLRSVEPLFKRAAPAASRLADREEIAKWRDDALEKAAEIVRRYEPFADDVVRDILALRSAKAAPAASRIGVSEEEIEAVIRDTDYNVAPPDGLSPQAWLARRILALLAAPRAGGETGEASDHQPSRWPNGCIKPNSCARHQQCMYGWKPGTCPHLGKDLTPDIEAAASRREGL